MDKYALLILEAQSNLDRELSSSQKASSYQEEIEARLEGIKDPTLRILTFSKMLKEQLDDLEKNFIKLMALLNESEVKNEKK